MAGHATGDGVNGVEDLDALGFEQLRQLTQHVLALGDGEAVARDDDDPTGEAEQDRDVLGRT